MVEFLKQHTLYLTPLSPIHMGSGEDFEPTNYVIDNGFLQVFDPSNIKLSEHLRLQLLSLVERQLPEISGKAGDHAYTKYILDIHNWFKRNSAVIAQSAYHFVPLSTCVENEYNSAFGNARNDGEAINKFEIERTAYHPISGQAYVPATAFKGVVRTAWLEYLSVANKEKINKQNSKDRERNYEKELLNSFSNDPMRLFKPADFMPTKPNIYTSVQYSINKYKEPPKKAGTEPKGLKVRRESIMQGQYRAFFSNSVLQQTVGKIQVPSLSMKALAQKCNEYSLKRFAKECQLMMDRGFLHQGWYESTKDLLIQLDQKLKDGEIMLLRLGKNTGAESKTDDKFASIKIMQGRKDGRMQSTHEKTTKTLWLASPSDKNQNDMLPFGWAIVEVDPKTDLNELITWCKANNTTEEIEKKFTALRAAQKEATEKARQDAEAEAKKAQEEAEEAQRIAEAFANMSAAEHIVYEVKERLKRPGIAPNNAQVELAFLLEKLNEAQTMSREDQLLIGTELAFPVIKSIVSNKREKEIKSLLRLLRGES